MDFIRIRVSIKLKCFDFSTNKNKKSLDFFFFWKPFLIAFQFHSHSVAVLFCTILLLFFFSVCFHKPNEVQIKKDPRIRSITFAYRNLLLNPFLRFFFFVARYFGILFFYFCALCDEIIQVKELYLNDHDHGSIYFSCGFFWFEFAFCQIIINSICFFCNSAKELRPLFLCMNYQITWTNEIGWNSMDCKILEIFGCAGRNFRCGKNFVLGFCVTNLRDFSLWAEETFA